MPFRNVVDDSSETVSAATPGWTVDLRNHTTHRLRSQGVPVRFKVCVNSTVGNDTGAIKLVDEAGATVLTCLVNNPAATTSQIGDWYWADGYVPATLAKYDVHYGGNTLGTLTPFSASLYEIDWTTDPVTGSLSSTLGTLTVSSYVPFSGDMSATLDALTVSSTATVEVTGTSSMTLDALTVSATGTVETVDPATYQDIGAVTTAATTDVVWPTHATDDYAILVVYQMRQFSGTDPGAATLSTSAGFTAISGASVFSANGTSACVRATLFECRATSASMTAPQVAAVASYDTRAFIVTFRGCTTSGSAVDAVSTAANNTSSSAVTVGGDTTGSANQVVLVTVGAVQNATIGSWTNADLASLTERLDNTSGGRAVSCATGDKESAGAYGDTTATLSLGGCWAAVTVSVKP